ncbi:hypothetical protein ACFLUC_03955, partial [Chloroflexota bacterium]
SKGAQPSDAAQQVFRSAGLLDRYERYKDGEDLETLLAEAKELEEKRNVNPKTQRVAQVKKEKEEEPAE